MTTSTRRRGIATAAAAALLAISGAACATGSGDGSGDSAEPASGQVDEGATAKRGAVTPEEAPVPEDAAAYAASLDGAESASGGNTAAGGDAAASPALQQAIISTGNIAMRSDDVGQAIFDVRKIIDRFRGQLEQDTTETDDEGDPLRSRMVLRIPTGGFPEAMEALEDVDVLITSSSNSKDVTTTVLDKKARIAVQRRSIVRISVLLDRAVSIRDIVNIESELSRRTAALASLERQLRYLNDLTAMSTITVSVERTKKEGPPPEKDDARGFFAGLEAGWHGLTTFAVGLATVLGALLPWMIVLAVLAIPGWPLIRRLRRREPAPVPEPAPTSG